MDESTDMKREGALIRYFDESTLHIATGFLVLQEVPEANASNLFECMLRFPHNTGWSYL